MKIDPSILCSVPRKEHERFERYAANIVCESFIFTGDRDYLTARFAFFQRQSHLFLWSTAQALEKYLKANILLLGGGVIKRIHEHTKLADQLRQVHPNRLDIDLTIPHGWAEQGVTNWPERDIQAYLQSIEIFGAPNVRYDQVQLEVHLQDLVFLDRLAFSLRHQLVADAVDSCKLVGDQLTRRFFDLNYSFAPDDHQHPNLIGIRLLHSSVTTLEAAVKGCFGHEVAYQEWASKSMGLNAKDLQRLAHRPNAYND